MVAAQASLVYGQPRVLADTRNLIYFKLHLR